MSISLHGLISDNMMIQEGKPARIWGKAGKGQRVRIRMAGKTAVAVADRKGNFEAFIGPFSYGGPHTLRVGNRTIRNVLVGDVWVCSGQSNMEWPLSMAANAEDAIKQAKYPKMRILGVNRSLSGKAEQDMPGDVAWKEVTPQSVPGFSAVGYFFGRELHEKTGKPIGLINTSWGGTRIEPWISMEGFRKWERHDEEVKKYAKKFAKAAQRVDMTVQRVVAQAAAEVQVHNDPGNAGLGMGLAKPELDDRKMDTAELPGYWTDKGYDFVGAVWYRKTVNIPESWLGDDLYLSLSSFTDFDNTYFNGESVGFTCKDVPNFWDAQRKYVVPAKIVRPGKNVIAVRVFAHKTHGGSNGVARSMHLSVINKPNKGEIPLYGKWKMAVEKELPRLFDAPGGANPGVLDSATPTWIHNSMIAPLVKFPIKGAIWYQGESNAAEPQKYAQLLPLMIRDWREKWNVGDFPFYIVSLAGYKSADPWPELRQAQYDALSVRNTGIAMTIDIGEPSDIHPKNKQDVGRRLALCALAKDYGKKVEFSGPVAASAQRKGKKIVISYEHAAGIKTRGFVGKLVGFEVAAKKGAFVPARSARVSGKTVVIDPGIPSPVYVRYAWDCFPDANLYNSAELPAVPFKMKIG